MKAADYMPISSWLAATNSGYVNEDNEIACELTTEPLFKLTNMLNGNITNFELTSNQGRSHKAVWGIHPGVISRGPRG